MGHPDHAHHQLRRLAGGHAQRGRVLHVVQRVHGRGSTRTARRRSRLLGEGWNGRTWSIQPDSTPAVAGAAAGISCTWAKDCVAVGSRSSGMTLAEHWNGRHWSAETTKHTGELDGASCPATGNCTAVGWNNAGKALAAHWNGKAWSDESPVDPQPLSLLLGACPARPPALHGRRLGGHGVRHGVLHGPPGRAVDRQRLDGAHRPDPYASTDYVELYSVSCTSAANCIAVGDDMNAAGTADATVAAQWNGSTWTPEHAQPGHAQRALLGVVHVRHLLLRRGRQPPSPTGKVTPVAETWNGAPGRCRPQRADRPPARGTQCGGARPPSGPRPAALSCPHCHAALPGPCCHIRGRRRESFREPRS